MRRLLIHYLPSMGNPNLFVEKCVEVEEGVLRPNHIEKAVFCCGQ